MAPKSRAGLILLKALIRLDGSDEAFRCKVLLTAPFLISSPEKTVPLILSVPSHVTSSLLRVNLQNIIFAVRLFLQNLPYMAFSEGRILTLDI